VVCVHRTADGKDDISLNNLGVIIQILIVNNKILILDWDWNINYLHKCWNEREFNNFLLWYNVKHTANVRPRITKYTLTMFDAMTINEKSHGTLSSLLITRCYQKYGTVPCSFPSLLHNVHIYSRCKTQASVYFNVCFGK